MVVLYHTFLGILGPRLHLPWGLGSIANFLSGIAGVDLFFVLSGFLIGGILIDHKTAANYFPIFWTRRAARILPPLVLLYASYGVAVAVGARISVPWLQAWLLQTPMPIYSYLTFTQNYFMAAANSPGAYWLGITWSLAVEEQFYLFFPFIVYFLSRRAVLSIAVATILLAPMLRAYLFHFGFYVGYSPTPARADGLMWGVVVAYAVRSPAALATLRRWRPTLDVAFFIVALAEIWRPPGLSETLPYSLRSMMFAYIIARIFVSDGFMRAVLRTRALVFVGSISYSLYLYHQAVNGLMHGLISSKAPPAVDDVKDILIAVAVLLIAGTLATLSTRYYEFPIRAFGRRAQYKPCLKSVEEGERHISASLDAARAHRPT